MLGGPKLGSLADSLSRAARCGRVRACTRLHAQQHGFSSALQPSGSALVRFTARLVAVSQEVLAELEHSMQAKAQTRTVTFANVLASRRVHSRPCSMTTCVCVSSKLARPGARDRRLALHSATSEIIMAPPRPSVDKDVAQDNNPPPSAFDEPSSPSQVKPADKPKETLVGNQAENPQVVVKKQPNDASEKEAQNRSGGVKSKL